ncbi:MAG TPA: hypothetical protein VE596_17770 [Gaiellaceae bacterium]|nr:hypothetical protein [Gaiellaceae bacterium]
MTAIPITRRDAPSPAPAAVDEHGVDRAIALGRRLVAAVRAYAAALDLPELTPIELPPVVGSEADQANLRAVAPLYLASELEQTGLVVALEMLAGIFATGGIQTDLGPAGPLFATFWHERGQRFTREERHAFYARLFGDDSGPALAAAGGRNAEFDELMIDLAEALYRFGSDSLGPLPANAERIREAAAQLAANLSPRSGGMTAYAAHDLLETIASAIQIFKQPAVQAALGARSLWTAVRSASERYVHTDADIDAHVTRGKAGQLLLAWLAETVPRLGDVAAVAAPDDPVIAAAAAWLEASLSIRQREARAAAARS